MHKMNDCTQRDKAFDKNMSIGTITFHWGTNYGAVLQAYALQQQIKKLGYNTEIIDYIPLKVKLYKIIINLINFDLKSIVKEIKFNRFRRQHLKLSKRTYYRNQDLIKYCNGYDAYICGSDQIWNQSFVLRAEGKPTLSYYLNFVGDGKIRLSYATSLGTDKLEERVIDLIHPELKKFYNISVREITGQKIIHDMGFQATLVADPTLLIDRKIYRNISNKINTKKEYYHLFSYILHQNQVTAEKIRDYVFDNYFNKKLEKKYNRQPISVPEWLYSIENSRFVITNSYHGTLFSIIFQKPFIVVPVDGLDVNNRIMTLLSLLGMKNRIVDRFDKSIIDELFEDKIDWIKINHKVEQLKRKSLEFLREVLD